MGEINGRTYDFSDIQLKVNGETVTNVEILGISYNLNRTVGKMRANGPKKRYRTRGYTDPAGEFRIPLHQRDALLDALVAASETGGFGDASVEITVTYGTDNQPVMTDTLEQCTILDISDEGEEGEDGLQVSIPIDIIDIDFNGKRCFPEQTA